MVTIWVDEYFFFSYVFFVINLFLLIYRLNSPTCSETFKKFLEPILKVYDENDDIS